jgi:hypothetical protein
LSLFPVPWQIATAPNHPICTFGYQKYDALRLSQSAAESTARLPT